jgi:glutamine cyclotransferase
LSAAITTTLVDRPPLFIADESTIAPGIDAELDELRALRDGGKDAIADIQAAERARTGIQSLKVGFNKVFGYYLEISNTHRERVPDDYQRRQTLTNGERYVTPALKEYEERVLTAAERIEVRERTLFETLRARAGAEVARLQRVAARIAELDVLAALAEVAEREGYVRPLLTDGFDCDVVGGRHPVVERMMAREKFIPNDLCLSEDARLVILTGPNMAGKSTILRQVGLIQLMAQVGSFVPATRATLGIVDRLFTRVGASDNLVRGQSTFMVEMTETSAILNTATRRSLVLLDEIGRGTSTYDGVSIAWSVSEHLHDQVGCKTIFATHYHELVALADELSAVRNMTVAVREVGDQVLFLHRLIPGGADRSYGIEVGRLAGLPAPVLARAKEVLALLEGEGAAMAGALNADATQAASGERRASRGADSPLAARRSPRCRSPARPLRSRASSRAGTTASRARSPARARSQPSHPDAGARAGRAPHRRGPALVTLPRTRVRRSLAPAAALLGAALLASCRGESAPPASDSPGTTPPPVTTAPATPTTPGGAPVYSVRVVARYPHDPQAFTQGLFFVDGQMFETTGIAGQSEVRRVDWRTGAVQQRRGVPAPYFGEGSVAWGGRLYQLTWKDQRAFVYDLATLTPRDTLSYTGEGWGLTTDGTVLYMSDGTAKLRVLDPRTFAVQRTIDVREASAPVSQLNELEWVEGEIYANVWQSEQIARIDPKTGNVVGWIDLTGILPTGQRTGKEDVLNGIAYDTTTKKLFVTGKWWPTLFEIQLQRR